MTSVSDFNRVAHGTLIRVARERLEDGWMDGFLVGTGPEFFVLHLVNDGIHLDGFVGLRYADVTSIDAPSPRAGFVERVLQLRGQRPKERCPVDLSSTASLCRSAGSEYPLITLHLEAENSGVCYVGKVLSVVDDAVRLHYITPDGVWEIDDDDVYRLNEITRVDLGGSYEEALALFAGEAPT